MNNNTDNRSSAVILDPRAREIVTMMITDLHEGEGAATVRMRNIMGELINVARSGHGLPLRQTDLTPEDVQAAAGEVLQVLADFPEAPLEIPAYLRDVVLYFASEGEPDGILGSIAMAVVLARADNVPPVAAA